ncbi:ADP-ribosylglycohydrolase family protein, partial [Staphylococcus aureus]|nr:ADP-ribosylglycohydrolase family protein [Staphylococcus aureus]
LEFARRILLGEALKDIYHTLQEEISTFFAAQYMAEKELDVLSRLLKDNIYEKKIGSIRSNGYVISTLEASIWCLMTSSGFEATVLNA